MAGLGTDTGESAGAEREMDPTVDEGSVHPLSKSLHDRIISGSLHIHLQRRILEFMSFRFGFCYSKFLSF